MIIFVMRYLIREIAGAGSHDIICHGVLTESYQQHYCSLVTVQNKLTQVALTALVRSWGF